MNTLKLNTNLHCSSCVTKLAPFMDDDPRIQDWSVDLKTTGAPVTVKGDIKKDELISLVEKAGYKASVAIPNEAAHCEMPSTKNAHAHHSSHALVAEHTPVLPATSFWGDVSIWKRASFNTFNCLIGCSIGDFGAIIFLQAFYPETSMALQMGLAIIAGLITSVALESSILRFREKLNWKASFKMAVSMSFISMIAMEIAMNLTDFMITGGKMALSSPTYWLAFIPAALAGFLVPLPYNYFKLKKYNASCH